MEVYGRTKPRWNLSSDTKYDVCEGGLKVGMEMKIEFKLEVHKLTVCKTEIQFLTLNPDALALNG